MKSIGLKLWSGIMLLVVVVLLLLWLFQIVFLEKFYINLEISDLIKRGNSIISEIKKSENLNNFLQSPETVDAIENLVYNKQMTMEIVDSSRNIIYSLSASNHVLAPGKIKQVHNETVRQSLSGNLSKIELIHHRFGTRFMIIGLPISIDNVVIGAVIMNVSIAPVEDTAAILKQQLLWITFILLLVSTVISFQLTKMFTKPIIRINKVAESFSMGKFEDRVTDYSKDEIGNLAENMNKMGEELSKSEQLRKDLIANVSHELRTPLSLIRGYAETLRDVTGNFPEKREKQLGVIIDETDRLSKIVDDILILSQFQARAVSLELSSFCIKKMIEEVLERYDLQVSVRDFSLKIEENANLNVLADKGRIEQVLFNLLNNAFHHTQEGDQIYINILLEHNDLKIEIIDTGVGMEQEELSHVFERYYKGKQMKRNNIGTGLGLAIVKNILDMHKVKYGVKSAVGQGSNFWFYLPIVNPHTSF